MKPIAVSIQNVSKKFRLFNSPEDRLKEALHPFKKKYHKEFWALKDISFDVPKGETIGIIGRNGSGKSTLLQIICGVLQPTTGSVTVNGRISALLELGADFNPEFTGRENVLMKGIRTGLSKYEIKERLPQIEHFADIGEFIDYPLKTYSSGMFVRLAFATAINIDPEILIVDEALAVGDAKFQQKCYRKFLDFQNTGKTIIFVTHDTDAVVKHCDSAILLEKGEIIKMGEPKLIITHYIDLLFTGKISNYQPSPVLVEEGCRGFNIIHYKTKYYAVLQSLGPMDFSHIDDDYLEMIVEEKKCVVGISFEEVKQVINQIIPQDSAALSRKCKAVSLKPKTTESDEFFDETPISDNCVHRKSYNKNECRIGEKRAEIIDYLIVVGDNYDSAKICSGDKMDIYMKAKFHEHVTTPLYGFLIKTIDGIPVYGNNSQFVSFPVNSVKESDVIIFKFSIKVNLAPGDFFIDLGVDEILDGKIVTLDKRCDLIHLYVLSDNIHTGLVEFETTFQEILMEINR